MLPINKYIKEPAVLGHSLLIHFGRYLPDKIYIKWQYRLRMGKRLNLTNPKTFSEKLQWLKLYNRKPEYSTMVDKYAVKDYVAEKIGKEHIITTFGVWNKPEQIQWDTLPNQFVLKTTNGGGSTGVVICNDKSKFDQQKAIEKLTQSLSYDPYIRLREWPYKNVRKQIIAEQYIAPQIESNDLPDYKFFCFNGEPKCCQVISGRNSVECSDFFDYNWNHQPFHEPIWLPFADKIPQKPAHLEQMWQAAKRLSENLPFARIDFYDTGAEFYFGEITFFPTSGMGVFDPIEYNELFGSMIDLPQK